MSSIRDKTAPFCVLTENGRVKVSRLKAWELGRMPTIKLFKNMSEHCHNLCLADAMGLVIEEASSELEQAAKNSTFAPFLFHQDVVTFHPSRRQGSSKMLGLSQKALHQAFADKKYLSAHSKYETKHQVNQTQNVLESGRRRQGQ